jgi:hypothetical protein
MPKSTNPLILLVAEERYRLSPHPENLRYMLRCCACKSLRSVKKPDMGVKVDQGNAN